MLDDLRRIIESEMEYDDLNDIMMEATDNAIAAMFIEEDGEAVISDAEVMGILEKIPEYDEETAMNKKLARIAEAYIPEELMGETIEESCDYEEYEEIYEFFYGDEDYLDEDTKLLIETYIEEGLYSTAEKLKKKVKTKFLSLRKEKHLKKLPILNNPEDSKNEFDKLNLKIQDLLKKEIPGCEFKSAVAKYNDYDLGDYTMYEYKVDLFEFNDKNKRRFIDNSDNKSLKALFLANKTAEIGSKINDAKNDISDNFGKAFGKEPSKEELDKRRKTEVGLKAANVMTSISSNSLYKKDVEERIINPISDMGFKKVYTLLVKENNGKEYIVITIGNNISIKMKFLVKKDVEEDKEQKPNEIKESIDLYEFFDLEDFI